MYVYGPLLPGGAQQQAAGTAYTLTVDYGAFVLSGQDVALTASRSLSVGQGSFTLGGQDVSLLTARIQDVGHGSFALSGQAVSLAFDRPLSVGHGSFTLSGQDVAFSYSRALSVEYGAFTLSGQDVSLSWSGAAQTSVGGWWPERYRERQRAYASGGGKSYVLRTQDDLIRLLRDYGLLPEEEPATQTQEVEIEPTRTARVWTIAEPSALMPRLNGLMEEMRQARAEREIVALDQARAMLQELARQQAIADDEADIEVLLLAV